jgi:hypothetical protein
MPSAELIEWQQSIERVGQVDPTYRIATFAANVAPLAVKAPKALRVVTQSGTAVAWFGRYKPPAPAVVGALLVADPVIEVVRSAELEFVYSTRWQYVYLVADDQWADDAAFAAFVADNTRWPTSISFLV